MSDTIYYTQLNIGEEDNQGNFTVPDDGPNTYAKIIKTQRANIEENDTI